MRLLVADDHPGYRLLVRTALADDDRIEVVDEVADVTGFITAAERTRPELALIDLLLPGGGGFAAAEALQELSPGAAVVVSSAHSLDELDAAGQVSGVGFLSKGTAPSALAGALLDLAMTLRRTEPPLDQITGSFPREATSSAVARSLVSETLTRWGCEPLIESARLLVSELVSNAVQHAGTEVDVALLLLPARVRFEVSDRSATPMRRRQATDDDTSGRGSELIDLLAVAWGVAGREDGKAVWFELLR